MMLDGHIIIDLQDIAFAVTLQHLHFDLLITGQIFPVASRKRQLLLQDIDCFCLNIMNRSCIILLILEILLCKIPDHANYDNQDRCYNSDFYIFLFHCLLFQEKFCSHYRNFYTGKPPNAC